MVMKPENRYYVLLGKIVAVVNKSLTLRGSVIDTEGSPESEALRVQVTVNGKVLASDFDLTDAEKLTEQELLDTFMGLYNVQL